jgi:hypothetical protein
MSSAPQSDSEHVRRRRRRRDEPKGWKAVPKPVKILVGICLLVLLLVPIGLQNGWIGRKRGDTSTSSNSGPSGLIISEAGLDVPSRTIKGIVKNTSKTAYRDVQVSYYIREAGGVEAGTILGVIASIGPNETAGFQTDPLPPNAREFVLREVAGTPR